MNEFTTLIGTFKIGTVKWFDPVKGYGLIRTTDGSGDVIVDMQTVLNAGLPTLTKGQRVHYDAGTNPSVYPLTAVSVRAILSNGIALNFGPRANAIEAHGFEATQSEEATQIEEASQNEEAVRKLRKAALAALHRSSEEYDKRAKARADGTSPADDVLTTGKRSRMAVSLSFLSTSDAAI